MGSTTYYMVSMRALELTGSVRIASERDGWANLGIEERMQRELNSNRIKKELAPYIRDHPDRFWGSIIVLVEPGSLEFEPLGSLLTDPIPAAYRKTAEKIGFLTINDGEHIALDGQHRLAALDAVVKNKIEEGPFSGAVPDDEMCVLFIEFQESQKTRRIFNKVNRHAKPTTRSDYVLTSEDDGNAIVTRWLLSSDREAPLAERSIGGQQGVINWKSNSLGQNSVHISTLSAVYETVVDILTSEGGFEDFPEKGKQADPVAPAPARLEEAYEIVADWWNEIIKIDVFDEAIKSELSSVIAIRNDPSQPQSLLLKPVGLVALVKGMVRAVERSKGVLSIEEAVRRANLVNFSYSGNSMWRDTVVRADGRMVARKESKDLAAELLAYLIGPEFMTTEMVNNLTNDWNLARGKNLEIDVGAIADDDEAAFELVPEDLPAPVAP